jgi:phage gp29-like protein
MANILDQFGRPIKLDQIKSGQSDQVAKLSGLNHLYAGHPSRGLNPAKLARILEQAEYGDIMAQHDLFQDMEEKDGHIFAEMSKRKRALLTLDWKIEPPRKATAAEKGQAEYVEEVLRDMDNFEDLLLDMLDAIGHGFACLEIDWQLLGRDWLPEKFNHRPQQWFQTDRETRSQIRLRDNSLDGAELWPGKWITHVHKAKSGYIDRCGLHRVLAWPFLFKNYSVRDLAEFLEIYGLPMRVGTYPNGASKDEKMTLLRAVTQIGHSAAGIIPEGMKLEFMEAAKGQSDPFEYMVELMERTQSKAILGGTLTSQADGNSSTNALGNVHNEVRHDLLESDAKQVASTITRDLVYTILAFNKGGVADRRRLPRFQFDTVEPEDIKTISDSLPDLVDVGVQIPVHWANERLRIPVPAKGEAVLGRVSASPVADPKTSLAALAVATEGQDEFDILSEDLSSGWEQITDPLISPILALANEVDSFEAFSASLPALIQGMDSDKLIEALAQGQFAAAIWGRVSGRQSDEA